MNTEEVQLKIQRLASRSYWVGAAIGLLLGMLLGLAIGYGLGSKTTVVIPLTEGVEV